MDGWGRRRGVETLQAGLRRRKTYYSKTFFFSFFTTVHLNNTERKRHDSDRKCLNGTVVERPPAPRGPAHRRGRRAVKKKKLRRRLKRMRRWTLLCFHTAGRMVPDA